jgi:hypothetical protein
MQVGSVVFYAESKQLSNIHPIPPAGKIVILLYVRIFTIVPDLTVSSTSKIAGFSTNFPVILNRKV